MPSAKAQAFTDDEVRLAAFARALAHPARIAILRQLALRQGCLCGDLVEILPLAQATVSQHLKVLKDAGLIRGETDGPRCCYGLNAEVLPPIQQALDALFAQLDCGDSCC